MSGSIKATAKLTVPTNAELTVTVSMPVNYWDQFLQQAKASPDASKHPSWQILGALVDAVGMARAAQTSEHELDV